MNFEIIMKDEVYENIFALMENINTLNKGLEIGAWLTGDWTHTKEKSSLLIDQFIIPKQEITKAEVDISPESMIDTIKELGYEESNRIKAHWHIHPFGKGDTNWSGVDEAKIKDFMCPSKEREIFVFLLSSEDRIKARVELRIRGKLSFLEENYVFMETFNNLPVIKESSLKASPYLEELKKRIDEKVTIKTFTNRPLSNNLTTIINNKGYSKDLPPTYELLYTYKHLKDKVYITFCNNLSQGYSFYDHLINTPEISEELRSYDGLEEDANNHTITHLYKFNSWAEAKDQLDKFEEELLFIEEEYRELFNYNDGFGVDEEVIVTPDYSY
jgi:hypothetical protein